MDTPADIINKTYDEQMARIKEAMADRNMRKVAEATGLHENTVYNIINDKTKPSAATLATLNAYLFPAA
jgi:DNA-binding phage protein